MLHQLLAQIAWNVFLNRKLISRPDFLLQFFHGNAGLLHSLRVLVEAQIARSGHVTNAGATQRLLGVSVNFVEINHDNIRAGIGERGHLAAQTKG